VRGGEGDEEERRAKYWMEKRLDGGGEKGRIG